MAAPALAVGAYLVQTRLPNAKCTIASNMGVVETHRFKNPVATAPLAFKRCAEVVTHQGTSCFTERCSMQTHALELDSGKRTRRI